MAGSIETQISHGGHWNIISDMVFAVEMGDNSEIEKHLDFAFSSII